MPFRSQQPLAPLPFGIGSQLDFVSIETCGRFLEQLPERPSRFDAIGDEKQFRLQLRSIKFPSLHLLSGTGTAKSVDHLSSRLAIVIPFGDCESVIRADGATYHWSSPHHAFLIPPGLRVEAESTAGAFLRIDIETSALTKVVAGMVGDGVAAAIDLHTPRTLSMRAGEINWQSVIRSFCGTVDAFGCREDQMVASGLDDLVVRTAAMMIRPDLFFKFQAPWRYENRFDLEPLVERIMDNLGQRITLSELETWSGRSARSLQLDFKQRFGVGPMQWIRDQRLQRIHQRLANKQEHRPIREIAAECGVLRMPTLVAEYQKQFGELPSDTRSRIRGRANLDQKY